MDTKTCQSSKNEALEGIQPELRSMVRAALSGKPERKIISVLIALLHVGVDTVEDVEFLAIEYKTPEELTTWFESEVKIPFLASMRLAHHIYKHLSTSNE